MLHALILLTRESHNIIKHSFNENIKIIYYIICSFHIEIEVFYIFRTPHFPHSALSTPRIFQTLHFSHPAFSTPRTLHSAFSTELMSEREIENVIFLGNTEIFEERNTWRFHFY